MKHIINRWLFYIPRSSRWCLIGAEGSEVSGLYSKGFIYVTLAAISFDPPWKWDLRFFSYFVDSCESLAREAMKGLSSLLLLLASEIIQKNQNILWVKIICLNMSEYEVVQLFWFSFIPPSWFLWPCWDESEVDLSPLLQADDGFEV